MQKKVKRLSKREMKKDALFETIDRVSDFTQDNSRTILGIGAIVVIAILALYILNDHYQQNEQEAANKLAPSERLYLNKDYKKAIISLENFIVDYNGTRAAGTATFYLANTYFESDDFENAQRFYENYIDDYGNNPFFDVSARAGLAACYEAERDFARAAEIYADLIDSYPDSFTKPDYMLSAARCFQRSGDLTEASRWLNQLIKAYPNTSQSRDAELQLQVLDTVSK